MKSLIPYLRYPMLLVFLSALVACSDGSSNVSNSKTFTTLDVLKSRSYQCCEHWIQRMKDAGFDAKLPSPNRFYPVQNQPRNST